jgi:DDE superfamily endonuclease
MVCTLDLYTDYLISSTGQTSATGLSRLFDGQLSHDQVTRWLRSVYLDSRQVWSHAKPLIRQTERTLEAEDFAVLIVDDSILEKAHTDANALLCTHYDHSLGRYVKGLNFVSLLYVAGALAVPIAVELVEKTQAVTDPKTQKVSQKSPLTKNEMLRAMLCVAQQQVAYRYLLADSWYASAENMNQVRELGHHFIFALPTSRTVALSEVGRGNGQFQALDTLAFPDRQPLRVWLRGVAEAVLVVRQVFTNKDGSQGELYLVSSDTTLTWEQVTIIYQKRWKIEEYHKSLKQNTSMGKSPTKTIETQANHFFSSILAYIKLEKVTRQLGIGHFRLKAQLYLRGLKAMHYALRKMAA